MSTLTEAQAMVAFVSTWEEHQQAVANGASWCGKCIALAAALQADPNFTLLLSAEQQQWVNDCVTFYQSLFINMPTQPTS